MRIGRPTLWFLSAVAILLTLPRDSVGGALLITAGHGHLVFEALEGHGATSNLEFGLGTPATDSKPTERMSVFTIHLFNEQIASVTPSDIVDMGFFPAGSALDFYNFSDFGGPHWAFSRHLESSPSAPDLEVFTDRDNSLGIGGSVVEMLGVDDWILHLDDAASGDDDDNEMVIRIRVEPVPEPSSPALVLIAGTGFIIHRARRAQKGWERSGVTQRSSL